MFTNNIHIYFSVNVQTLYYIDTVDAYMTAVCINVCTNIFNVT